MRLLELIVSPLSSVLIVNPRESQQGIGGHPKQARLVGSFKRERRDVGRSVSREDESALLDAIRLSRSPALLPLFTMAIDTGLRATELPHLRRRDLRLKWKDGFIESGEIAVSRSKTEGGTGRIVPLSRRACAVLSLWLLRFLDAEPNAYVFPKHSVGFAGNDRKPALYDIDLAQPIGEWKTAWEVARDTAKFRYRWHACGTVSSVDWPKIRT